MVLTRNAAVSLKHKELTKPEVDYTRGFGSFDFLPVCNETNDELPRQWGTDNSPTQSAPLSQHEQSFHFKRLPAEIRVRIYQMLLGSLYGGPYCKSSLGNGICFHLTDADYDVTWEDSPAVEEMGFQVTGDPDKRNLDLRPGPAFDAPPMDVFAVWQSIQADPKNVQLQPSGWLATEIISLVNPEKDGVDLVDPFPEPGESDDEWDEPRVLDTKYLDVLPQYHRRKRYNLSVGRLSHRNPACEALHDVKEDATWGIATVREEVEHKYWMGGTMDNCTCDYRAATEYEDIRILAQVSGAFTEELGHCLWAGATLRIGDPELFFPFARDRPTAVSYIRGLVLELQLWGNTYDPISSTVLALCEFVAENMKLNTFKVVLAVATDQLFGPESGVEPRHNVLARQRVREWEVAFRKLKVDGTFSVDVIWEKVYNPDIPYLQANRRIEVEETRAVEEELRAKWLPDCLRAKEGSVEPDGAAVLDGKPESQESQPLDASAGEDKAGWE